MTSLGNEKESFSEKTLNNSAKRFLVEKSPERPVDLAFFPLEADQSDSDSDEEERILFEIEEIKDFRFERYFEVGLHFLNNNFSGAIRSGRKYLIKWSGVDENGKSWPDSWEPAEHLEGNENYNWIKNFHMKQAYNRRLP